MKKTKRYYKKFILLLLSVSILFTSQVNVSAVGVPIAAGGLAELVFSVFMTNAAKEADVRWTDAAMDSFWEAATIDERTKNLMLKIEAGTYLTGQALDLTLEEIKNGTAFVKEKAQTLEYTIEPYAYYGWSFLDKTKYSAPLSSTYKVNTNIKKIGDLSATILTAFATYLKKDLQYVFDNYYAINTGTGIVIFVEYGQIYLNTLKFDGQSTYTSWVRNRTISANDLYSYQARKKAVGFSVARQELMQNLTADRAFYFQNSVIKPLSENNFTTHSATEVYALYDKWVFSDSLVIRNLEDYNSMDNFYAIDFYSYNLSRKAFKDREYGIAIDKGISIPLTDDLISTVGAGYAPLDIAKAVYKTGILEQFVYKMVDLFDAQTATQKTFFQSVVDAITAGSAKVVDSIGSATDALLEKIGDIALTARVAKQLADEAIQGTLAAIKEGVIAIPDKLDDVFVDTLPATIASAIALALEGDLPSNPNNPDDDSNEPARSKSFFENLLYLFIYIAMILIKLLQIFIQLYIFIFSIFNIPASTSLLPNDFILGLEYMRSFPLPLFNLTLYQFMTGVLNIILLFSVIGLLRKYIFRMKIPEAK